MNTIAPGPLFAAATVSAAGDGDLTNNSAQVQGWVQTERDLELTAGPAAVDLAVGGSYEVPLLVRSRGSQPTGSARLSIGFTSGTVTVELIDSEGATCSRPDAASLQCELGVLAPGATQLVRLRVSGSRAGVADISAMAEVADDGYTANNFASVQSAHRQPGGPRRAAGLGWGGRRRRGTHGRSDAVLGRPRVGGGRDARYRTALRGCAARGVHSRGRRLRAADRSTRALRAAGAGARHGTVREVSRDLCRAGRL